ncbi:MAG: hypothetical protein HOJ80_01370, partial [Halieaceae bacterium]|nr:hypothetical protein [Halieaceae bacterium]
MPHAGEQRAAAATLVKTKKAPTPPKVPAYMIDGLVYTKRGKEVTPVFLSKRDLDDAMVQLTSTDSLMSTAAQELKETRETLAEVKRVSANAIQLDQMTKSLTGKLEEANGRNDLLKLENARLQDRISSNRAIEVVVLIALGIMIALLVPRLSVKRRRNDGWR